MIDVPRASVFEPDSPTPCWDLVSADHIFVPVLKDTSGHHADLATWDIADDGAVSPSVMCLEDGCGFHDFVRLFGWSREEYDRKRLLEGSS